MIKLKALKMKLKIKHRAQLLPVGIKKQPLTPYRRLKKSNDKPCFVAFYMRFIIIKCKLILTYRWVIGCKLTCSQKNKTLRT